MAKRDFIEFTEGYAIDIVLLKKQLREMAKPYGQVYAVLELLQLRAEKNNPGHGIEIAHGAFIAAIARSIVFNAKQQHHTEVSRVLKALLDQCLTAFEEIQEEKFLEFGGYRCPKCSELFIKGEGSGGCTEEECPAFEEHKKDCPDCAKADRRFKEH